MADDLQNIEREIAAIQKNEARLEYVLAVAQIINAFHTVKAFMANMPQPASAALSPEGFVLQPDGFLLDDLVLKIQGDQSLAVFKDGNKVQSDSSFLLALSKRITALTARFIETMKKKMAEEKEKLLEELKNF